MSTEDRDSLILVSLSLILLMVSLVGSFITTGSLLDLIFIIVVVGSVIRYIMLDIEEKKLKKANKEEE